MGCNMPTDLDTARKSNIEFFTFKMPALTRYCNSLIRDEVD